VPNRFFLEYGVRIAFTMFLLVVAHKNPEFSHLIIEWISAKKQK